MNSMTSGPALTRRGVLAGIGGMTFCVAFGTDGVRLIAGAAANTGPQALSPWVRIAPDGIITIYSAGAEMGQGSLTSLAVIVAEEMDADWAKVKIEFAPSEVETYGSGSGNSRSMSITGSRAVRSYWEQLRIAGAQVRKILIANAAQKWGVDAASLKTEPSAVVDPASGQRLTYGEIAATATMPATLPAVDKGELKKPSDFRLVGKSLPRYDIPSKVDGSAVFAMDVQLPGMVYASTVHSPVQEGEPERWNEAAVKALRGVIATVPLRNGVAVVADSWEHVLAGRRTLRVIWKKGAKAAGFDSEQALTEHYAKVHADPSAPKQAIDTKGDANAAFSGAAKTYKAEFRSDLGYHAQMEPLNATVRLNAAGDRAEVWDGTQSPDRCRAAVAKALGLKLEQVTVNQCYMGGGFGRRSLGDYTVEAALVAKAVGKPVKLIWTREEDIAHGMFRPQTFQCLEAALDGSGKVVGWRHCIVGDGRNLLTSGIKIPYYAIPNQNIELRGISHGARLKHWRAVAHLFNIFAIDGFVDQMATAEGMDPIDFRLQRMSSPPRTRKVFEQVAEMADWKAKRPEGRALGISITERSGSLGAGVVEISLDRSTGRIRVHKVWTAVDGGTIVQPDAAIANIESGIIYGLSSILYERITMRDGVVEQSNFHDYNLLRMSDVPEEMHVSFVESTADPTGLGEISTPFMAAAVANAFHKLTGKRLYHMPFTPERVLEALNA